LPDPRYLEVHAACAKVSYFSGAGDFLNKFSTNMKESLCLASDGSSFDVLNFALGNAILAYYINKFFSCDAYVDDIYSMMSRLMSQNC
jgi:hypothetical protein